MSFVAPDLSAAMQAIEGMRGRLPDEQVDRMKAGMESLQRALAAHDWEAAQAAGRELQAAGQDVAGAFGHPVVNDPHGVIEQHRTAVAGPEAGRGLVV